MNENVKIAKELVKLAKSLVAENSLNEDDFVGGMPLDVYDKFMKKNVATVKNAVKNAVKSTKFDVAGTFYLNDGMSYNPSCIVIPTDEVGKEITIGGAFAIDDGIWCWTLWMGDGDYKTSENFGTFDEALHDLVKNIPSLEEMI